MGKINQSLKNRKRQEIIEAAVTVFAEKGFFGANVTDVARQAGVADGTIYLYFKNKDDLLISLFEEKMEHILTRFRKQLELVRTPTEKLIEFLRIHFDFIREDKNLAEVFQVELRQSSKFLKDYHNQKFLDYLNIIGGIISDGQRLGDFRPDINLDILKIMVFGAIDEVARQWILGADEKYSLDEAFVQVSKTIIDGIKQK